MDGIFSASPVAADGKIYFVSETGETIVLRSGREPRIIARNDIGERLIASPAISNGQIFLRGDDRLIAVGSRGDDDINPDRGAAEKCWERAESAESRWRRSFEAVLR